MYSSIHAYAYAHLSIHPFNSESLFKLKNSFDNPSKYISKAELPVVEFSFGLSARIQSRSIQSWAFGKVYLRYIFIRGPAYPTRTNGHTLSCGTLDVLNFRNVENLRKHLICTYVKDCVYI